MIKHHNYLPPFARLKETEKFSDIERGCAEVSNTYLCAHRNLQATVPEISGTDQWLEQIVGSEREKVPR